MTPVHPETRCSDPPQSPVDEELGEQPTTTNDVPSTRWSLARCRPWLLTPSTVRQWLVFLAFWGVIGGGLVYLFIWGFPKLVDSVINPTIQSIEDNLSLVQIGLVVVVGAWIFPVFIIPKDPFVWLAAIVFPIPIALLLVEIADVLTISTTFWLGRTLLQKLALRFLNRYKRAKAVLRAVKQAGQFKVVLLLSLGPVPKLVTHYIIAFPEDITFWTALAASVLGCLPGNALGVVFGHNITGLSDLLKGETIPTAQLVFIIVSLTAAVVIVVLFFWYAKRALREIEEDAERQEQEQAQREAEAQLELEQIQQLDKLTDESQMQDEKSDHDQDAELTVTTVVEGVGCTTEVEPHSAESHVAQDQPADKPT